MIKGLDEQQKKRILDVDVFKKNKVNFAYLFGSRVTGQITKTSDYDFAVMLLQGLSLEERFNIRLKMMTELEKILKKGIDLVILNDTQSLLLKYSIVTEGKLIYDKDTAQRIDFEILTQSEYFDFKPFLDEYNRLFVERSLKE